MNNFQHQPRVYKGSKCERLYCTISEWVPIEDNTDSLFQWKWSFSTGGRLLQTKIYFCEGTMYSSRVQCKYISMGELLLKMPDCILYWIRNLFRNIYRTILLGQHHFRIYTGLMLERFLWMKKKTPACKKVSISGGNLEKNPFGLSRKRMPTKTGFFF